MVELSEDYTKKKALFDGQVKTFGQLIVMKKNKVDGICRKNRIPESVRVQITAQFIDLITDTEKIFFERVGDEVQAPVDIPQMHNAYKTLAFKGGLKQ